MGASVRQLYQTGQTAAAEALLATYEARRLAWNDHPLARAMDTVSEDSLAASLKGQRRLKVTDFKNGQIEVCIWQHVPDPRKSLERAIERDLPAPGDGGGGEDDALNKARSVRRSKKQVRHKCKAAGVSALWTLTYRENQTDRDLALKHLDRFRRRVEKLIPGWRYVAVLEEQERGAWHIHLATHSLPRVMTQGGAVLKSWDVMRGVWRAVGGVLGGAFNESDGGKSRFRKGRPGAQKSRMRAGAIASYIAGYVAKDMESTEAGRKRYSCSTGIEVPRGDTLSFPLETAMADLIELAYSALSGRVTRRWFDPESQVFFAESEAAGPLG